MPNPDPYDDRDDDTGQFRRQYPDSAFLDALADRAFAPTRDVAETVGCSYETAYKTLRRLHDKEAVERHDVGAAAAWSLTDTADRDRDHDRETTTVTIDVTDDHDHDPETTTVTADVTDDHDRREHAQGPDADADAEDAPEVLPAGWPSDDDVDAQIATLDLSGAADSDEGRAAIRAMYDYVRAHGSASKQDFLANVYPDHDLGISERGWWNGVGIDSEKLGEGFSTLAKRRDDLRPPAGGLEQDYEYLSDNGDDSNSDADETGGGSWRDDRLKDGERK